MKSIYKNKSFIIIFIILVLIDLTLLQFPLTNILGFEYCFVNCIVICFFVGLFTLVAIKKNDFKFDKRFLVELLNANVFYIILPFIISIIASFFILNCSLIDGIYFYLIMVIPSGIAGFAFALIPLSIWRKFRKTIFILFFLLILTIPLFEFYFNPQVYFYNPIFGYYPGTIYDETIKVDGKLILYRLINLLYFGTITFILLSAFLKNGFARIQKKLIILMVFFIPAILFYLFSGQLGFSSTSESLKAKLGKILFTEHFEICFDKSLSRPEIELIGLSSEYFYESVKAELKIKNDLLITVFVFKDNIQKKNLFGSANADVSKPWLRQIFVDASSSSSTLKHEIVHAVSGDFGKTIFKLPGNWSMALTEGVASAVDYCPGSYSNHYFAFLAEENGYLIPVDKLFTGFNFFGQVSTLSYIYSGSFCKYLIDTYGVEKFKRYYSAGEFELIYGKSIKQVEKDYLIFLKQFGYDNNQYSARLFFARQPIFKKVCARFFSGQIDEGWELFSLKDYVNAKNKFRNLLNYSGSYNALYGYICCLNELKEYKTGLEILETEKKKYDSTSFAYNFKNLLADQYILNGKFENANDLYAELLSENPSYSFNITSLLKLELLKQPELLKQYIANKDTLRLSILKRMNADTIFYASIPFLSDEKNTDSIVEKIKKEITRDSFTPNSLIQALGILSLAKDYFQKLDFETAKLLLIKALIYKQDKNLNEVLYSQLKKVNWMCNFADDIKSKFSFKKQTE